MTCGCTGSAAPTRGCCAGADGFAPRPSEPINFAGSAARYLFELGRAGFRRDERLRALGRWTLVHGNAFASSRRLERYR